MPWWSRLALAGALLLSACAEPPIAAAPPTPPRTQLKRQALGPLDGDWPALRLATLQWLSEDGLVTPDEAKPRLERNIGALLPYSGFAPAARMMEPIPDPDEIVIRFRALELEKDKVPSAYLAERAFLLEALAPLQSTSLAPAPSLATSALEAALKRIDRLHQAGLIDGQERRHEIDAIVVALEQTPPSETAMVAPVREKPARRTPSPPRVQKNDRALHLLSMADPKFEGKAWRYFSERYDALRSLPHWIERVSSRELGTTYYLLAGPLPERDAYTLCQTLKAKGETCALR